MHKLLALLSIAIPLAASPGFFRVGSGQAYAAGCPSACSGVITAIIAANAAALGTGEPQVVELNAFSIAGDVFLSWTWAARVRLSPWVVIRTSGVSTFSADTQVVKTSTALARVTGEVNTACDFTGVLNPNHYLVQGVYFTTAGPGFNMFHMDCPQRLDPNDAYASRPAFWFQDFICNWCVFDIPNAVIERNLITVAGDRARFYNSYIGGGHDTNGESHSIAGVNIGDGFVLQNSTVYALGTMISFLFGGATPVQRNAHATNITITGNYFFSPFKGKRRSSASSNPPTYTGDDCAYDPDDLLGEWWWRQDSDVSWQCTGVVLPSTWAIVSTPAMHAYTDTFVASVSLFPQKKNNFELKNVRGGWIEGNIFFGAFGPYPDGQQGGCVLINLVDNSAGAGTDEWHAMIRDVAFVNNKMDNCGNGINQSSFDGPYLYKQRVSLRNNQFTRVATQLNNDHTSNIAVWRFIQTNGRQGDQIGGNASGPAVLVENNTYTWSGRVGNGTPDAIALGSMIAFETTTTPGGGSIGRWHVNNNVMDAEGGAFYDSYSGQGALYNALPYNCTGANGCQIAKNLISMSGTPCTSFGGSQCTAMQLMWLNDINGGRAGYSNAYPGWVTSEPPDLTVWVPQTTFLTNPIPLGGDYSLKAAYLNSGLNGGNPGVRYSEWNAAQAGVATGNFSAFLRWFNTPTYAVHNAVDSGAPASGTVRVEYNSPVSGTCSVMLSLNAAVTSGLTFTDGGGIVGSHRTVNASAGLVVGREYWGEATCGAGTRLFGPFILK